MINSGKWSKENEKFILEVQSFIIGNALDNGFNVIVDDTNFAHEDRLRKFVEDRNNAIDAKTGRPSEKMQTEFEIKDFTHVPVAECIARDRDRKNTVGRKVILEMYNKYLKPEIPVYKYEKGKRIAICVDLDGTLAHMVNRGPFDWGKVGSDELDKVVFDIVDKYSETVDVIVVSGRDAICRGETEMWLRDHNVRYNQLFMRPKDNVEKDSIIKERIFREMINPYYNILFILDDRQQVVDMYRSLGLKVLQVAEGNF